MTMNPGEVVLRFDPEALERCYAVADVMDEDFGRPTTEYALLGLAAAGDPLRVVATPLLPRQRVTAGSVEQPGHGVFALRREIAQLSRSRGTPLIPISFVHRHPGSCKASVTDFDFLLGPFLRQLSTVVRFEGLVPDDLRCVSCAAAGRGPRPGSDSGLACSLIVNREREHALYAAARTECPRCGNPRIRLLPARLAGDGAFPGSRTQRTLLKARLREEIAVKIEFPSEGASAGVAS